ncbi:MAG: HDIG domain-containing protein [Acidobacteriota bacterium]|nr:HDIG domain-containing protein [Acidobacteriota bacterium]
MALLAIVLVYRATVDLPLAIAAVVAVATAAQMHGRLAMGRWKAALLVAAASGILVLAGAPPRLTVALLVGGLAGSELIAQSTRRSAVLLAGVWTGVATATALLAFVAGMGQPLDGAVAREALGALAGGVLAVPLLQMLGPVLEWVFGHTTRLTMAEWLSFEHPLLRELAAKAPGTFQHSINVGVLAASGTSAIGGDALLAHVGGLYHDVGKLRAPEYFIENQQGPNPHDALTPWDSARILRAHVFEGIDLVRAHGMGDRITAFVREHHGTGAMRLQREKAEAMGRPDSDGDAYRYPGPRPQSRETGVVMIADQLDATARSAPPADEAGCAEIVERTMVRIQGEEQLGDSGLSAGDLERLRAAFTKALVAMYHRRLTYPPSGAQAPPAARLPIVPRLFARSRSR